jgi:hypothetical protein
VRKWQPREQPLKPEKSSSGASIPGEQAVATAQGQPNLTDPRAVLALLETDQVVAEKRRTRFGRRHFSLGLQALLWSLRMYVLLMLIIVVIAVFRAVRALH